jgi:Fe-S cluster assembly protein SufD
MTAEITPIRTAAETGLAEAYAVRRNKFAGGAALAARRDAAFRNFSTQGLPHRHVEAWKYTDLRALMHDAKPLAEVPDDAARARAEAPDLAIAGARRVVFVDGIFIPELSDLSGLEPGLKIRSLAHALGRGERLPLLGDAGAADGDVAYALNTAFMGDGVVVDVSDGTDVARPLHLDFVYGSARAAAVFSRSLVTVGKKARLTLIESHEGPDGIDYQVNAALDVAVGDNARLDCIKVNREGCDALHLSTLNAMIGAHAEFAHATFLTGGGVVRNQLFVTCAGTGSTLSLNGASLLKGKQHADTALLLDHAAGGCRSRELFKSVLDGASHGIFQGKIIVRPGAQKTDARMMTRALMLSEEAEAANKPELEIFADDVQCGHGATTGALDDHLKFYLMARGIPEKEAESLLIQSFVGEALEAIANQDLRDALTEATMQWLSARQ